MGSTGQDRRSISRVLEAELRHALLKFQARLLAGRERALTETREVFSIAGTEAEMVLRVPSCIESHADNVPMMGLCELAIRCGAMYESTGAQALLKVTKEVDYFFSAFYSTILSLKNGDDVHVDFSGTTDSARGRIAAHYLIFKQVCPAGTENFLPSTTHFTHEKKSTEWLTVYTNRILDTSTSKPVSLLGKAIRVFANKFIRQIKPNVIYFFDASQVLSGLHRTRTVTTVVKKKETSSTFVVKPSEPSKRIEVFTAEERAEMELKETPFRTLSAGIASLTTARVTPETLIDARKQLKREIEACWNVVEMFSATLSKNRGRVLREALRGNERVTKESIQLFLDTARNWTAAQIASVSPLDLIRITRKSEEDLVQIGAWSCYMTGTGVSPSRNTPVGVVMNAFMTLCDADRRIEEIRRHVSVASLKLHNRESREDLILKLQERLFHEPDEEKRRALEDQIDNLQFEPVVHTRGRRNDFRHLETGDEVDL